MANDHGGQDYYQREQSERKDAHARCAAAAVTTLSTILAGLVNVRHKAPLRENPLFSFLAAVNFSCVYFCVRIFTFSRPLSRGQPTVNALGTGNAVLRHFYGF